MSIFGKMFGGKKGEKPPTTGEAIQQLRETEEMLLKKQEFLESKIEAELTIARANGSKNKRGQSVVQTLSICSFHIGTFPFLIYQNN